MAKAVAKPPDLPSESEFKNAMDGLKAETKRMKELIGENATVAIVKKSGHSVHLEQLEDCAKIIMNWLEQQAN